MTIPLISTSRITISLKMNEEVVNEKKSCGFHLTKSKWDPYPWVGYVERGSIADIAGLKTGDCLLQIDQIDVVGLRVKEIASLIKQEERISTTLHIWRGYSNYDNRQNKLSNEAVALHGPLPILIRKFLRALSNVMSTLDCPICLETAVSPVSQCVHGHILCAQCRAKSFRCPVCRVKLGQGRCLIADEVQRNIKEAFQDDKIIDNNDVVQPPNLSLKQKLFGKLPNKSCQSHTDNNSPNSNSTETLNIDNNVRKTKTTLSHIIGSFDRALSADNLTRDYEQLGNATNSPGSGSFYFNACRKFKELTTIDRAKSASTSELCGKKTLEKPKFGQQHSSVASLKSSWGGSMESLLSSDLILCPLVMQNNCLEPVHREKLSEHIAYVHNYNIQINIYGSKAMISMATLIDAHSIYIFHYDHQLFILQYQNEAVWITGTCREMMKWYLHAWTSTKTEFKIQRNILLIDNNVRDNFASCYVSLPTAFSIESLCIEIVVSTHGDELSV